MRRKILLGTIILCLIGAALLVPGMVSAEKITRNAEVIYEDDYQSEWLLGLSKGEKIDINVDVTSPSGATVDVYILSSTEKDNYPSGSFSPTVAHEDVTSADFTFKSPNEETYYLIIDNIDNTRSADAIPTGDVTVDYEYDNPLTAIFETAEDALWTGFMICIIGIVIVVVIIIVIVVLLLKSGKSKQQPPPQQPYPPQQQYPQQGGYPPQGQPYQPPPGEQPPVQPGEQPPDQQQGYYPPPQNQGQWPQQTGQPPNQQGYYPPQQQEQPPNQGQRPKNDPPQE